jgi:hypothetical protein
MTGAQLEVTTEYRCTYVHDHTSIFFIDVFVFADVSECN